MLNVFTRMNRNGRNHQRGLLGSALLLPVLYSSLPQSAWAADNIEIPNLAETAIHERRWVPAAYPMEWVLNENGVTNNATPISIADAEAELTAAFQAWENVPEAVISASYGGTTSTSDLGCDLENIVTWDDSAFGFSATTIAVGWTFVYQGPPLIISDVNRDIGCGDLDPGIYPNGSQLPTGAIFDADMIWNDTNFNYSTTPNSTPNVHDIRAVATHEFGHLFGVSHTSMVFSGNSPATMYPAVSSTSVTWQNNVRSLEADDEMAAARSNPGMGFYPTGTAPWTTGSISGRVRQINGTAAQGVRVWAYNTADLSAPVYEAFTATQFDAEAGVSSGEYEFRGVPAGSYYVCIVPWGVNVPNADLDNTGRYNLSTLNGSGNTGFATECYDDAPAGMASPDFSEIDRLREVDVATGETTPNINFVTGAQNTDVVLVMDRSGSMNLSSAPDPSVSKMDALKYAANVFMDFLDLDAGHRAGLVQFHEVVVPFSPAFNLQPVNAASLSAAHTAINSMTAGGMTNIIDGVNEGIAQLTTAVDPSDRQIMLLLTDGLHNRPVGTSVTDITAPLLASEVTLYSVGFGTSTNEAELTPLALSTGGVHLENKDVSDLQLRKHFLSIAASAADSTTLIDPHYDLAPGESAVLDVPVLKSERDLTFAVMWSEPDPDRFDISLRSPRGCTIATRLNKPGVQIRKGDTHRLVNVKLPYKCMFRDDHAGEWKVIVSSPKESNHKETSGVDIAVYGDSTTHIFAQARMTEDYPVVEAKIVANGEIVKEARMTAEIILAAWPTGDSEAEDYYCSEGKQGNKRCRNKPVEPPLEERIKTIELNDYGSDVDRKKGDGIYSAILPTELPGSYQVRVIADYSDDSGKGKREVLTSYYFDGKQIVVAK
ncbi:VWA domain-containing protein [Teredinibacter turnerae]|uniref:VWA domain-containing protein n=1 Tax=Teredinibacter turnerae TaxID=2426 RepID=UPI0030D257D1